MLSNAKNGPEPKVREAKCAAHLQTRRNNPSADGLPHPSSDTNCSMVAKTVKNRGALYNQQLHQSALGSKVLLQAIKDWHKRKADLFKMLPAGM